MNKNIVAIIPARGGSKSIPRKNIKQLGDYPLIAYSIAAGLQSKLTNRVIVSTDDEEIAEVARQWGAEVPFMRPAALAQDDTLDYPVFEHAVQWLEDTENYRADIVVQLRPTSPFRPQGCLDAAIQQLLQRPEADSVRGITPSGQNPFKMWQIDKAGVMQPLLKTEFKEPYNMPRQKLPATYWQTGHLEVMTYHTIMHKRSLTGDIILPYQIPSRYAIDLDTLQDWAFAEYVLENYELEMIEPKKSINLGVK